MSTSLVIAIDAMGGDQGPRVALPGAAIALARHPECRFLLIGDSAQIEPELKELRELASRSRIVHTDKAVAMGDKPSQALMRGRYTSSMWMAIDAARKGEAAVAISGGNTGALMAMSKVCLKMLPGIERPVMAAIWPTVTSECLVLDVGANVGATALQLVSSSMMGAAMAGAVFNRRSPRVALLNIGVEEVKGLEEVKRAHVALRAMSLPFEYRGFVEADQIGHDAADVVVTDGFTGNIAIKTAEGTAKQVAQYLRQAMEQSLLSQLGGFIAQDAFRLLKAKMDPRRSNGGVFLGLNGLVIKSHGGTDPTGYASAVDLGYQMARAGLLARIIKDTTDIVSRTAGALAE